MKLIGTETGRILQLFRPEEIRPLAGAYLPAVLQAIKSRYEFATPLPDPSTINQPTGAKFSSGHFMASGVDIGIIELSVYNDGVIVTCSNTDLADVIADDMSNMMVSQFQFRPQSTERQRTYTSIVIAELELSHPNALGVLDAIADRASEALNEQYGWDHIVAHHRLEWRADPLRVPHLRNTQFAIERRGNAAYDEQRYWCTAPLPTAKHLVWLEWAEKALLSLAT